MKTAWDYTNLADAYLKRPDYADSVINTILEMAGVDKGAAVCDIGAGAAHLTLKLAERGLTVTAVEPNDAMRTNGVRRTLQMNNVTWVEGVAENTKLPENAFELVTFGSSFNVTDRAAALIETSRILRPGGHFVCMWNHRNLKDPIQKAIEDIIKRNIDNYRYGSRREDQTSIIESSGLFRSVQSVQGTILYKQSLADCVEAWHSHATLERQAGEAFGTILSEIETMLKGLAADTISTPYKTRAWVAKLK